MYIWKMSELREKLIKGELEESESFKYLIANTIIITGPTIPYGQTNRFDTLSGIVGLFAAVLGTWIAYKANGGKDGYCFLPRYLAICWVAFVRFLVLISFPLVAVKIIVEQFLIGEVAAATTLFDVFFIGALEALYVAMVIKHIHLVATNSSRN